MARNKPKCSTCKDTGVVMKKGKQEPCPVADCVPGKLARALRRRPKPL